MMDGIDINAEYERIFGVEHRASLFDGDEQYAQLRQEIMEAPIPEFKKGILPFERIKILPYDEYLRSEVVKDFESRNIRTFFIKKYQRKKLICYGAGYFNIKTSKFVVFRLSFGSFNEYHKFLLESSYPVTRAFHEGYIAIEDGTISIEKHLSFDTASLAASFILGERTTFEEWRDHKGKSLNSYYTRFRNLEPDSAEYNSVPVFIKTDNPIGPQIIINDERSKTVGLLKIINMLQSPMVTLIESIKTLSCSYAPNNISLPSGKRVFMIHKHGRCSAYGYFEEKTQFFYICKGSRIALTENASYVGTSSSKARKRFLNKACTRYADYYLVNKDAKCKSASAAACYVLGEKSDYTIWKDAIGKYLKDVYPNYFFSAGIQNGLTTQDLFIEDIIFHLERNGTKHRTCNAEATYNNETGQITIKKRSLISLEVSSSFRYSVAGIKRLNLISKSCKKQADGYILINDVIIENPDVAASIVTGMTIKGLDSWLTPEGDTLGQVLQKI